MAEAAIVNNLINKEPPAFAGGSFYLMTFLWHGYYMINHEKH
jgi:hypothetical protein